MFKLLGGQPCRSGGPLAKHALGTQYSAGNLAASGGGFRGESDREGGINRCHLADSVCLLHRLVELCLAQRLLVRRHLLGHTVERGEHFQRLADLGRLVVVGNLVALLAGHPHPLLALLLGSIVEPLVDEVGIRHPHHPGKFEVRLHGSLHAGRHRCGCLRLALLGVGGGFSE